MMLFRRKPKRVIAQLRDIIQDAEKRGDHKTADIILRAVSDLMRVNDESRRHQLPTT